MFSFFKTFLTIEGGGIGDTVNHNSSYELYLQVSLITPEAHDKLNLTTVYNSCVTARFDTYNDVQIGNS